jgi:hypothetical protein
MGYAGHEIAKFDQCSAGEEFEARDRRIVGPNGLAWKSSATAESVPHYICFECIHPGMKGSSGEASPLEDDARVDIQMSAFRI